METQTVCQVRVSLTDEEDFLKKIFCKATTVSVLECEQFCTQILSQNPLNCSLKQSPLLRTFWNRKNAVCSNIFLNAIFVLIWAVLWLIGIWIHVAEISLHNQTFLKTFYKFKHSNCFYWNLSIISVFFNIKTQNPIMDILFFDTQDYVI